MQKKIYFFLGAPVLGFYGRQPAVLRVYSVFQAGAEAKYKNTDFIF
jgi:hypothetical protein